MIKKVLRTRGGFFGGGYTPPKKAAANAPRTGSRPVKQTQAAKLAAKAAKEVIDVVAVATPSRMGPLGLARFLIVRDLMKGQNSYLFNKFGQLADNLGGMQRVKPGSNDAKVVPAENGVGALRGTYVGMDVGDASGRIIKFKESYYDGPKDSKLVLAKKLFGTTTVNYFSTEKSIYNRLYAYSGLNSKGLYDPFRALALPPQYSEIDTTLVGNNLYKTSCLGETLYDTALMLKEGLLSTGTVAGTLTNMPPLGAGDIDYYFPIQSWKSVIKVMNTNTFLPCTVKIYTVQAKVDISFSPHSAWYNLNPATGSPTATAVMNQANVTFTGSEPITGIDSAVNTYINLHPQATPGMSQYFSTTYRIISVRTFTLKPSDQLQYEFTRHFGRAHSAAEYNQSKIEGQYRQAGAIDFIVEFQGPPTPYYKTLTGGGVDYSAMSHCSFSKIRVTVDKSFVHSFPVSNGLGLYLPSGSQYSPSFVGTRQIPVQLFADTAPYTSFAPSTTTAGGKYVIPIVSAEIRQSASPQIVDPT